MRRKASIGQFVLWTRTNSVCFVFESKNRCIEGLLCYFITVYVLLFKQNIMEIEGYNMDCTFLLKLSKILPLASNWGINVTFTTLHVFQGMTFPSSSTPKWFLLSLCHSYGLC